MDLIRKGHGFSCFYWAKQQEESNHVHLKVNGMDDKAAGVRGMTAV